MVEIVKRFLKKVLWLKRRTINRLEVRKAVCRSSFHWYQLRSPPAHLLSGVHRVLSTLPYCDPSEGSGSSKSGRLRPSAVAVAMNIHLPYTVPGLYDPPSSLAVDVHRCGQPYSSVSAIYLPHRAVTLCPSLLIAIVLWKVSRSMWSCGLRQALTVFHHHHKV